MEILTVITIVISAIFLGFISVAMIALLAEMQKLSKVFLSIENIISKNQEPHKLPRPGGEIKHKPKLVVDNPEKDWIP